MAAQVFACDVAMETIMAGNSLSELIACTSLDHGENVSNLLALECPLFIDGRATCIEGLF
jgi:hypothetical protein